MAGLNCNLKNRGFSLLELIISVAVLAIGITSVLQAFSASAVSGGLASDLINASFLAKDKIQELEFKEKQTLLGKESQQVREKTGKFDVLSDLDFDPDLSLYRSSVDISWSRSKGGRSLRLNTFLR